MIAIIDYGVGNLGSVKNALDYLGFKSVITNDKNVILNASKVILPGVGAFGDAMNEFNRRGFKEVIFKLMVKNTPILGICVGMQMLFERSYEYGVHEGLGILKGNVIKFEGNYKIPEIGWNEIEVNDNSLLLKGLDKKYVYFVHSYHVDESAYATSYAFYAGVRYPASIRYKNVYATQFHPEKSGEVGLKILKNFGEL